MSPKPSHRFLISGWYGNENLGDEAQLSAILYLIREAFPSSEITVVSDNPKATSAAHGVKALRRKGLLSLMRYLKALRASDLFILGGGELLYDVGPGGNPVTWLKEILWSKLAGTRAVYFNGGVGLIYNPVSKVWMRQVCNALDGITVRDDLSKKHLESLGVKKPVQVTADSVLALARSPMVSSAPDSRDSGNQVPQVGVNLRPWLYKMRQIPAQSLTVCSRYTGSESDFSNFRKSLADALDSLKASGMGITFFPICFSDKQMDENDPALAHEIAQLLKDGFGVQFMEGAPSPTEMMKRMRTFDFVIAMRLHALVFAALLKKPLIAISYDPKVNAFMERIGQSEFTLNIDEVSSEVLVRKINDLLAGRENIARVLEAKGAELAARAESCIPWIIEVMNRKVKRSKVVAEGWVLVLKLLPYIPLYYLQRAFAVAHRLGQVPWAIRVALVLGKLKR